MFLKNYIRFKSINMTYVLYKKKKTTVNLLKAGSGSKYNLTGV